MRGKVVHCLRQPFDVYIGREYRRNGVYHPASKWQNPFHLGPDGSRDEVISKYRERLLQIPELLAALPELRGKRLGCFCAPKACHGDVLLELAEKAQPQLGLDFE